MGDATKNDNCFLTYPSTWTPKLIARAKALGATEIQVAIRAILAKELEEVQI